MSLDNVAGNGQTEARARMVSSPVMGALVEALEDVLEILFRNAGPGIGNDHLDLSGAAVTISLDLGCHNHPAPLWSELQGIAQEIVEHLLHSPLIEQKQRQVIGNIGLQVDSLLGGNYLQAVNTPENQSCGVTRREFIFHHFGFHLRQIEDGADSAEEAIAMVAHDIENLALRIGQRPRNAFQQKSCAFSDCGERGAQFMGNVSRKVGLEPVELFELLRHSVEGAHQFGNLFGSMGLQGAGKIALAHMMHVFGELLQRPAHSPGMEVGQQERSGDAAERHPDHDIGGSHRMIAGCRGLLLHGLFAEADELVDPIEHCITEIRL